MKSRFPITQALGAVRRSNRAFERPSVERLTPRGDAFRVLIATILSLRTKDGTTLAAARRLFEVAATPEDVLRLTAGRIERLIFPVGFYRVKARTLREVSRTILERFGGRVPDSIDDLLTLKGVGRKTANLVLTHGHDRPGICVDVHVHRITNRWGYLRTRNPEATEMRLRDVLPARHWKEINGLLVTFGQSICRPVSPWCSRCPLADHCPREGVGRAR